MKGTVQVYKITLWFLEALSRLIVSPGDARSVRMRELVLNLISAWQREILVTGIIEPQY